MKEIWAWWEQTDGTMKRFYSRNYFNTEKYWQLTFKQIKFLFGVADKSQPYMKDNPDYEPKTT